MVILFMVAFVCLFASTPVAAESGIASVYNGGTTASGRAFRRHGFTAAHRTLPFGSRVRVTNKRNGRSVVVIINDRGPFVRGRVVDLTPGAARAIGLGYSIAPVHVQRVR